MQKLVEPVLAALLFVVMPYSIGFTFLASYFDYFGINMSEVQFPQQQVLMAFGSAARQIFLPSEDTTNLTEIFAIAGMIVALGLSLKFWLKLRFTLRQLFLTGLSGYLITATILLTNATEAGEEFARNNLASLPFVMVLREDSLKNPLVSITEAAQVQVFDADKDRLVYADGDTLYIIRSRPTAGGFTLIRVPVDPGVFPLVFNYQAE
jgi:hypothetical protein